MLTPDNVLILTAVQMEADAIGRVERNGHVSGMPATAIGIGATRLARLKVPASTYAVVVAGLGGALDPTLNIGDVVIDGSLGTPRLQDRRGVIYSVDRVVSTPQAKADLFAQSGAAVVDMELAAVRRWAEPRRLKVVGVRAISDRASDAVPAVVTRFVNDVGRVRPLAIAAGLLRRPSLVPDLRRLQRDAAIALLQLGPAVHAVCTKDIVV